MDQLLNQCVELAAAFGGPEHVRGGGGNISVKNDTTLWVKPSGTPLAALSNDRLLPLDRPRLRRLYELEPPADPRAREALVAETMAAAVLPGCAGRPSVEAPLHESFPETHVLHTHPALANGMTCSVGAAVACAELFPEALWIGYLDPGYTLCMETRRQFAEWKRRTGRGPQLVFLQNHGVFAASDTPGGIREIFASVYDRLEAQYRRAGVPLEVPEGPVPDAATVEDLARALRGAFGEEAACVHAVGPFHAAPGPLTPDHMVYSRARPFFGEPVAEDLLAFARACGGPPRVVVTHTGVYGVAPTEGAARLAVELARDGARVIQLTRAFGGVNYMTAAAQGFIETWEAESYRRQAGA